MVLKTMEVVEEEEDAENDIALLDTYCSEAVGVEAQTDLDGCDLEEEEHLGVAEWETEFAVAGVPGVAHIEAAAVGAYRRVLDQVEEKLEVD